MKFIQDILSNNSIDTQFDSDHCDGGTSAHCDRQTERSRSPKLNAYKIIFILTLFLISGVAGAQQIKATARLDSTNILLGDQINLFLEIEHPKSVEIEFPQVPDSLNQGLIEVLSRSGIDTFQLDNEELQKQIQSFTITCFDSGSYRIAPSWFKICLL